MRELIALVKRNVKLFFKDKGLFFTSLITPMILLVLYATFLANVYRDSFFSSFPEGIVPSDELAGGFVGGQLMSSLLAVCTVTVAFCSNMLMAQDKISGARKDLTLTPVKPSVMALSYYVATVITTMLVCLVALCSGFIYLAVVGWYLRVYDCLSLLLDVFLLVSFGTALSSLINRFLSSQGQISAVGTIVSAGYGFVCGAYMPISQFSKGIQTAVSLLPGTYGTALVRNHALGGVFEEMEKLYPLAGVESIKESMDCNLSLFGCNVSIGGMYAITAVSVLVLIAAYVLVNAFVKQSDK